MINNKLYLLFILIVCALSGCTHTSHRPDNVAWAIEQRRTEDLRSLFRTPKLIEELEAKRVCRIEVAKRGVYRKDIFVGNGLTLDQVILKWYGNPYDGQVKVISRDAIVQTALSTYEPEKQKVMMVSPGDLVLVQWRD